jgi:2',3'-cyclic-nucleotide 2'-phosphodiesterase (5'-nucleotidase family)
MTLSRRDFLLSSGAALAAGCSARLLGPGQTETVRQLTILYTNDEHGWMEPYQETAGAAGVARLWRERENVTAEGPFLVLSGGDMWTGPALSTALAGESMADVMNAMGYQAAALGNHDFDFGLQALRARRAQSAFPFLSANLRDRQTGDIPEFAAPFLIREVNGIRVGVIGLTTTETAVDTRPEVVSGLRFLPYKDVLPETVAAVREQGAELVVLLSHLCASETRALAPLAAELGIPLIGGGHCHEEIDEILEGVQLIESGYFLRGYVRVELLFDRQAGKALDMRVELVRNRTGRLDPGVQDLMAGWRSRLDPELWQPIGYADQKIGRTAPEMAALLLPGWLQAWPGAEVALAEPRYVQQDLYPGDITPATVIGLLSTTNQLVEIELSGAELLEVVESRHPLVWGVAQSGELLQSDRRYRVLVPDALYHGGWYYRFQELDPDPVFTGIDWRDPTVGWVRELDSSQAQPIALRLPVSP